MMLLSIFDFFPHWMGIATATDLVLAVFCMVLVSIFYFLIGYGLCACNYTNSFVRCIVTMFWPAYLVLEFIILPFKVLYYLSVIDKKNN